MKKKFFIITTVSESVPFFKGQINVLKEQFNIRLISSPGKELAEIANSHDVDYTEVAMQREITPIKDAISLLKLFFLFIKEKPCIVHGNTPKGSFLSMIAAWFACVPIRIYYVHGLRYQSVFGKKRKLLMVMEKISCYLATDIISVSKGVKEQLIADKLTTKQILLIGNGSINGIDTSYFSPGNVKKIVNNKVKEGDFVFGFVGRLVKDKGVEELIFAFLKVLNSNNKVKLLIVGNFEKGNPLSYEVVKIINTHPNILYMGGQKDVRPFIKTMDLFILPSYREGFGIVLIEAASMKKVAIASNISGCNEIILNNKTGFLFKSKNIEDLVDKMTYALDNKTLLINMGNAARKNVQERFDQNKVWENTSKVYFNIVSNKNV